MLLAHAEMVLINKALPVKGIVSFYQHTSMFVTLEPCAMCAAAISETRIERYVLWCL